MNRRTFFAAMASLALVPEVKPLRGLLQHGVVIDSAMFLSWRQRGFYSVFNNQMPLVAQALDLHRELPITSLLRAPAVV
jgi:hypothetical protein